MAPNHTLLFLHLLSAFALVAALVLLTAVLVSGRRATGGAVPALRLTGLAGILWNAGGLGVIVFGVWMAVGTDGYRIVDGWILAAIALWFVASAAGGRLFGGYRRALGAGGDATLTMVRERSTVVLLSVMSVTTLALLIVMIYKPGA